jgi:AAA+ ATPase superfamily predicted ATPase
MYLAMYFDEAPKTSRKDIFDYTEEFQKLADSLSEGRRLIQIKGRRRSGKTSLLLSCLNELKRPFIVLDGRAFSSYPQVRREEFVKLFENTLNGFLKKEKKLRRKIVDALKHVQGLEASTDARVSLRWGPGPEDAVNISSIIDALSHEAIKQKTTFVIAFDEAQEFRKIMKFDLTSILAHGYDYAKGLQFVVTGSEVGMLHNFLRIDEPKSPLYGRATVEIELSGLNEEQSKEFLKKGFAQIRLKVRDEMLENVHLRFDGIVGWLTYCGLKAMEKKKLDRKIIDEAAEKATRLVALEFKNFIRLHKSNRYSVVMRNLAKGNTTWADLKRAVESREGVRIGQGEITKLLSNLEDAGFVAKGNDGTYFIADPMVIEGASKGII